MKKEDKPKTSKTLKPAKPAKTATKSPVKKTITKLKRVASKSPSKKIATKASNEIKVKGIQQKYLGKGLTDNTNIVIHKCDMTQPNPFKDYINSGI